MLWTFFAVLVEFGSLAAGIAFFLLSGACWHRVLTRIESHHPALWRIIGPPESVGTPEVISFMPRWHPPFYDYVVEGRYRGAGDPVLSRWGDIARFFGRERWVMMLLFLLFLILAFVRGDL